MPDRRAPSLLDFAIAASMAVVPIMLGVVLLVAWLGHSGRLGAAWRDRDDRHIGVRRVAALKTFELAIRQRPAQAGVPPSAADVLAGVPQCRRDWSSRRTLRGWLAAAHGADDRPAAPAEVIAARLAELDGALLRFSSRANAQVSHAVGLDAARWFAAASSSLATAVESAAYPGRPFQLQCSDLAAALDALAAADARMLERVAWRGTEAGTALARWQPEQEMAVSAREVMRRNPWRGIAGCIYLGRGPGAPADAAPAYFVAGARSLQRRLCERPALAGGSAASAAASAPPKALGGEPGLGDPVDDPRWMVPPSIFTMLEPLESLRQPSGSLYRLYTGADPAPGQLAPSPTAPNRVDVDGAAVDVGFSIDLTIDPALQALAQKTAACYTGRHAVCRALAMRRNEDGDRAIGEPLLEGAMVRMAAVAVIDVASGRIEALAGAASPCARQEVDGPGRDAACDKRLPYPVRYRPDALLNPAVFHDAMPASTIKPIMAAAFLSDPDVGMRWLGTERAAMRRGAVPARDSLRGQLMRSDSARFLDRMFCLDKGFARCRRPWEVQAAASAFGWNAGCTDARSACGKRDLLFGRAAGEGAAAAPWRTGSAPLSMTVAYGRLMSEPLGRQAGAAIQLMPAAALDPTLLARCAAGADGRRLSDDDWEKCRGGALVDVVAEGWGQGHARSSALGVAGMMATLAAAANGQSEVRRPHLVESLHGVRAAPGMPANAARIPGLGAELQPIGVAREAAQVILSGLSYSHRAGTARSACEQVFDARRCADIDWLAGKTGTPSFPGDGVPLDELARQCGVGRSAPATKAERGQPAPALKAGVCSSLRPYKWYVAAYRSQQSAGAPWDKAIAVLTERNWIRRSGQVHGAGDHGPNPAAEIALQIVGRQLGLVNGAAP